MDSRSCPARQYDLRALVANIHGYHAVDQGRKIPRFRFCWGEPITLNAIADKLKRQSALAHAIERGPHHALCDTHGTNLHLIEIAVNVTEDRQAIVIMDQAGWQMSNNLMVPENITILPLPPKSPELNKVENIWQFMRDKWLSNRVLKSCEDSVDHCCYARRKNAAAAMGDHFNWSATMGAIVLMNDGWSKSGPRPTENCRHKSSNNITVQRARPIQCLADAIEKILVNSSAAL